MQPRNTFDKLVQQMSKMPELLSILSRSESQYNLKKYKITEICVQNVLPMYQHIVQKFYKNHQIGDSSTWVENQLRLFIWAVICYLYLNNKTINEMEANDWSFFNKIFYVKESNLFEYQARTLLDVEAKIARWSEEEDYMLYQIIIHDKNAKWNEIAKSLYLNSGKRFLRPSKQCRQRWLNHLDPNKSKSCWTIRELLSLFEHVEEKGKKWALLVRKLNNRRGQHTIKNKYNSIIKKQGKITLNNTEEQLRKLVMKRLNQILETQTLDQNDQFILGLTAKTKNNYLFETNLPYYRGIEQGNSHNDNIKKKFEDFRKKIQKFSCDNLQKPIQYKHEPNTCLTKNSRVANLLSKLSSAPFPNSKNVYTNVSSPQKNLNSSKQNTCFMEIQNKQKQEDDIFYEDSYQQNEGLLKFSSNQIFLAEEINNFINQSQLDL